MMYKWIGSMLVFSGCAGFGFSVALSHRKKEKMLEQIKRVLSVMECELRFRLTPLPELCNIASKEASGAIKQIIQAFSIELNKRISPDAASCMSSVLERFHFSDRDVPDILIELGRSLGRFDLDGQLMGIDHVNSMCIMMLKEIRDHKTERIRSYQTLGLCAGAALVILLV